jgi:hypothetical protein
MTSLVVLTDVEAALVGGGAITQTISVSVLQQDIFNRFIDCNRHERRPLVSDGRRN